MRQINEKAFDAGGVSIEPGEKVLFVSRSGCSTRAKFGTYIGTDFFGDPVVRYPSRRFYYKSKTDNGWKPTIVTTSLPRKRLYSVKHYAIKDSNQVI